MGTNTIGYRLSAIRYPLPLAPQASPREDEVSTLARNIG
jgi:hypothetical protein